MKKIYIVITYTGTALSKIIKYYLRSEFSHVSISLDENLEEMYSFGRLNPYNPFYGSFVQEGLDRGTFKRFYKTRTKIYSIDVTNEQYEKIKKIIKNFNKNKEDYKFNVIGLFAVAVNKKIQFENSFYCAEFVNPSFPVPRQFLFRFYLSSEALSLTKDLRHLRRFCPD